MLLSIIQLFEKHKIIFIGILVTVIVGAFLLKSMLGSDSATQEQARLEALQNMTAEDVLENLSSELPNQGNLTLITDYKKVPFAMECTTTTIGNTTMMTGRSAVDPENNAFNNSVEQYIEQIGNIDTFYTKNPDQGDEWIKETFAENFVTKRGFKSMASLPGDLKKLKIDEESKSDETSAFVLAGTLVAEDFPNYFYNIFGEVAVDCDVRVAVDKGSYYIVGIEVKSKDKSVSELSNLSYIINYTNAEVEGLEVPEDVREVGAQEGCLLYYIKDEALNTVKTDEE